MQYGVNQGYVQSPLNSQQYHPWHQHSEHAGPTATTRKTSMTLDLSRSLRAKYPNLTLIKCKSQNGPIIQLNLVQDLLH